MSGDNQNGNSRTVRFGVFDVDLRTQELRKHGTRVKLPRQSFQVLQILLERPGDLVTREELQKALWPADTFVDFDHGLNNAVKRIRAALGDSAETPKWIETLPRLGYRFIGGVEATNGHHSVEMQGEEGVASAAALPMPLPAPSGAGRKWIALGAVGVLLLLIAGAWEFHRLRLGGAAADTLRVSPFTSYPGYEFAPTFSPDGNQIAFAWSGSEESSLFDLYVKVVGTDTPVQLTHTPASVITPSWSPDGRFIAFSRLKLGSTDQSGVFVVPAVGGPERKLAPMGLGKMMYEGGIAWSPDSHSLIYPEAKASEFEAQFVLLNIDTLERRPIPTPDPRCMAVGSAQFSSDGKALAFACMFNFGLGGLYVQPWPSGQPKLLLEAKGEFAGLAWSEDGRGIVYALNDGLWRVSARGGSPQRLWFAQHAYSPAVARTGARLAYTYQENSVDLWKIPLPGSGQSAGPAARLAPSELSQQNAQFSPDGKRVAFESTRSGSPEVWVCSADGSNLLKLTSFEGPLTGTPRWSPDGSRIVLDSRASGKPELYIVNSEGGTPKLVPTTAAGGSVPYWSHDGKWIYFASELQGATQIFKIPAEGGPPVQLTKQGGFVARETADGSRLYYLRVSSNAEIWTIGTDGTGESRVEGLPEFAWPAWDLTNDGIYYYDALPMDREIYFFDFATRRTRRAVETSGRLAPFIANLSISPDGKQLLYTQLGRSTADIMLVDNFR